MSFDAIATGPFEKKVKKLSKKYKSLKSDLGIVIEDLQENPQLGTPLERQCFKVSLQSNPKIKGNWWSKNNYVYPGSQKDRLSTRYLRQIKSIYDFGQGIKVAYRNAS